MNAPGKFLHGPVMAAHQAHGDLEVLGRSLLGQLEHAAGSGAVGRDRLFHEHVETLLDGIGKMDPAERQRRGKNGHVARLEAIHRVLVAVKADEPALRRHIHLVNMLVAWAGAVGGVRLGVGLFGRGDEALVAGIEFVGEDIGHGHQFDGAIFDVQGVDDRAGAASAATDQGHLNRVAAGGMDIRDGHARQGGSGGETAGSLDKLPAGGDVGGQIS